MNEFVFNARRAILCRFLSLNARPGTGRPEGASFFEIIADYKDGYRQARAELIADGCIDIPRFGVLRLTEAGYREALGWAAEM